MKVMLIDPWCSNKQDGYTIGFCNGMCKNVDLTLISAFYESRINDNYSIIPLFFKKADRMRRGKLRMIIRGIEYIHAYIHIISLLKKDTYDVVHVEWALLYKIDPFLLKQIKKRTKLLVYTAHNAVPHVNGERFIRELKRLHSCFDLVLVHGDIIKEEYTKYFPEDEPKLLIQRHGVYLTQLTTYDKTNIGSDILNKIQIKKGKIVTFIGNIFYNKGADRLINIWINELQESSHTLIVAGEVTSEYKELNEIIDIIKDHRNIIYIPRRTNDDEFAYILSISDIVVMPYRHASMSGVVFSAAAFNKAIIYTDVGSISEYVTCEDSIRADNSEDDLKEKILYALEMSDDALRMMGRKLYENIYNKYNWDSITHKLYIEGYSRSIHSNNT